VAFLRVLALSAAALPAGCGGTADQLPREAISGTVTFKGEPLKAGTIQFLPTSPREVTAGGAVIVDGKYTIGKSEGLVPGRYQVLISGAQAAPAAARSELPGASPPVPPAKEPIPAKYNSKSELTADVKNGGRNTLAFELKDK
jgi:hypothetical protein